MYINTILELGILLHNCKLKKFSLCFKVKTLNYLILLALKFKMPLVLICSPLNLSYLSWYKYILLLLMCLCVFFSLFFLFLILVN